MSVVDMQHPTVFIRTQEPLLTGRMAFLTLDPGLFTFRLSVVLCLSMLAFSRRVVTTVYISVMIRPQMINYKDNFIIYLTTTS